LLRVHGCTGGSLSPVPGCPLSRAVAFPSIWISAKTRSMNLDARSVEVYPRLDDAR
jgi:hypothetical protein